MTQPIDKAFVEILPDFDAFAREVQAGVDQAMRNLRTQVEAGVARIEQTFANTGEQIGREFQTAGETAERAMDELGRAATADAEHIGQVFSSGAEVAEGSITELRRSAGRDFDRISREATVSAASVSGKFSAAFAATIPLLAGVSVAIGAGLAAITGFGLKATANLEQTRISFDSLLGSAEKGGKVFADLQQFAAITPFEFPEVAGAAQRFFAFNDAVGLSDDAVRQFLTTLGNVASVTGGGSQALNSVTLAMGQIASSGKVTLDNLNQISEALPGFSGVAAIASATGKSTAQVMEDISSGSISAKDGITALLKGMDKFPGAAGAMQKQSQTLLGVFSTFKDTLSQALVGGFEPVIPQIKQSLSEVTPILQDAIKGIAPILGQTLTALLPLLGQFIQAITPILGPLIKGLGDALKVIGPALKPLGESFGRVAEALVPLLDPIAQIIVMLAEQLVPVINALIPSLDELVPIWSQMLLQLLPLIPSLAQLAVSVLTLITPLAKLTAAMEKTGGIALLGAIVEALTFTMNGLADVLQSVGHWLGNIDWGRTASAIGGFFATIWNSLTKFFRDLGFAFMALPQTALNALGTLAGFVRTKIGEVLTVIHGIPGQIRTAVGNLGGLLVGAGQDVIRGLWNGISSMGGWLRDKILGFVRNAIPGPLRQFFGIASPSKFMAEEIGRPLAQGIGMGFADEASALERLVTSLAGGIGGGAANAAAAGPSAVFGPGSIVIRINGTVTEDQARKIGAAVGGGAVDAMSRRGITTAVRQV